jgi:hypothetical protein
MNFWTPTFDSWGKGLVAEDMPWYLMFDYVEVYDYDVHTHDFKLHWRDDFDHFDPGRWFKQSGTFEANSSIFHTSNVYADSGNLVIKMEPEHIVDVLHPEVPPSHAISVPDHPITTEHQVEKLVHKLPKQPLHARD